jgi:hypothetical protein
VENRDVKLGRSESYEFLVESLDGSAPEAHRPCSVHSNNDDRYLGQHERSWILKATSPQVEERLRDMFARSLPKLCWITTVRPEGPDYLVFMETREFPMQYEWRDHVQLGVDEKIVEDYNTLNEMRLSASEVLGAMAEEFLIPGDGNLSTVIISAAPQRSHNAVADTFRAYGRRHAIDVTRSDAGVLLVSKIRKLASAKRTADKLAPVLARANFEFSDSSVAGSLKGAALEAELEQIAQAGSYLDIWQQYNDLETRILVERARSFGVLAYSKATPVRGETEGRWRFSLGGLSASETQVRLERLLDLPEPPDLEASKQAPDELLEQDIEQAISALRERSEVFAGQAALIDPESGSVEIQLREGREHSTPPPSGFLFLSWTGDRVRLDRRNRALDSILNLRGRMPQLAYILQGAPVDARRRKMDHGRLSPAARAAFGEAGPTRAQLRAIEVALATPDVALIQGPPGTGKTRVMAALQAEIAALDGVEEPLFGRALLTSYQHDAVENLADATTTLGMPAIKVGRRQGQRRERDGFDRWRRQLEQDVSADLSGFEEVGLQTIHRRVADRAASYLQAPSTNSNTVRLLSDVVDLVRGNVDARLVDALVDLRVRLARKDAAASGNQSAEHELALKAARGLRTTPEAFGDDGRESAYRLTRRIENLGLLDAPDSAFLQLVANRDDPPSDVELERLGKIRSQLIDTLAAGTAPLESMPTPNVDVERALAAVVADLENQTRVGAPGIVDVLTEYQEDLHFDIEGTREAVLSYTTALAATCSQAASTKMRDLKGDETGVWFETVLIDEAARANPLDLLIPMSMAKRRIVLVGDHRQLPHLLEPDVERGLQGGVTDETRDVLSKSLFYRLFEDLSARQAKDGIVRTVTLDTQFRMHPRLGAFVSEVFYEPYGEAFGSGTDAAQLAHELPEFGDSLGVWVDIPSSAHHETSGQSKSRPAEALWIAKALPRLMEARPDLTFGVITFYKAQERLILRELADHGITERGSDGAYQIRQNWTETEDERGRLVERLRIGTVDAFQGKEFDVAILSVVRSNAISADSEQELRRRYGYLTLENRLCVAMSRQKRLLISVGNSEMFDSEQAKSATPGLWHFMQFCRGDDGLIIQP